MAGQLAASGDPVHCLEAAVTHAEFVRDLLSGLERPTTPAECVALAQVHATMALVEAVENWQPPEPPDDDELPELTEGAASWLRRR